MAAKFYAVKNGRIPGIYTTWDECAAQVNGYSGAVYKSFASYDEAYIYYSDSPAQPPVSSEGVSIYVDGSYDVATNLFSYGMVVVDNGTESKFNQMYADENMATMRNVAGEIRGAMAAMQYCLDHDIAEVTLFYDYEGIAKWPLREWRATKVGTQQYVQFYDSIKSKVTVHFVHVKGHSGNKYNEMADQLAKEALGLS